MRYASLQAQRDADARKFMVEGGVPLLLSGATVSLAERANGIPDLAKFGSPFRRAVVVEEIRFSFFSSAPTFHAPPTTPGNFGNSIRCKLTMGRVGVSFDPVPIWGYGPLLQDSKASLSDFEVGLGLSSAFAAPFFYGQFIWRLPVPLLVPSGAVLSPVFNRTADGLGGTVIVDCAYAGRALPPTFTPPSTIDVPFVSVWVGAEDVAGQQSGDMALVNPFRVPLNVQRFIGRAQTRAAAGGELNDLNVDIVRTGGETSQGLVRLRTSDDQYMTGAAYPWSTVFEINRRAWTTPFVLPGKGRVHATVTQMPVAGAFHTTPMISMVGWRREEVGHAV